MARSHRKTRVGDEYQCSCGLTWDVHEDDPHSKAKVQLKIDVGGTKKANEAVPCIGRKFGVSADEAHRNFAKMRVILNKGKRK